MTFAYAQISIAYRVQNAEGQFRSLGGQGLGPHDQHPHRLIVSVTPYLLFTTAAGTATQQRGSTA